MVDEARQVYISYKWGGESERIVNELDADLQAKGMVVVRDKRDLRYTGSISAFMEEIGRGRAVIVVISDEYLRSANCMRELVEIAKNEDVRDRIFPVILSDARIYEPAKRLQYVEYWKQKHQELDAGMQKVGQTKLHGFREELDLYDTIRDEISNLTAILKDMNTLTPEMHRNSDFAILFTHLEARLGGPAPTIAPPVAAPAPPAATHAAFSPPSSAPGAQPVPAAQPPATADHRSGLAAVPTWLWVVLGVLAGGILLVAVAAAVADTDDPPEDLPPEVNEQPFSYGDDAFLDELWDACESGVFAACDDLYLESPVGSDYEFFGDTCGALVDLSAAGECAASFGP
ncbi:MAG: toll/interleukin-1 receptor domain-containing protein [Ilumatobacter sp.]|uniref:toll/interleukin-1 receptor domain-containing protein n=1 Tax=Ilumatobacter sp. TaxID=1967498 RepID=UPI0026203D63|nr:toll/interleukin-1 receptor domain-containing protein [Ilumatobacter sp.]MDJ0768329.1 toll/interleukin-1 receptor domain-containing protein [Ilumatobacter sp.]